MSTFAAEFAALVAPIRARLNAEADAQRAAIAAQPAQLKPTLAELQARENALLPLIDPAAAYSDDYTVWSRSTEAQQSLAWVRAQMTALYGVTQ